MFVISEQELKKWVMEHLGVDPPDSAIRRAQMQLTAFVHTYFAPPRETQPIELFNRESKQKITVLGALSAKARRIYQQSVALHDGRFHYGNTMQYERDGKAVQITFLWTRDAVDLPGSVDPKISDLLCSKTVRLIDSSVFSEPVDATILPVSDLRATISRDKKHQRMLWVGFDGKKFYRQREIKDGQHLIPMDGASEIVSFFLADEEIMCSTVKNSLVLVGPQRVAVVG